MLRSVFWLLPLIGLSCGKTELAEIPTFISIETTKFVAAIGQGTDHQLISEIWTYADSQLIGAYAVPSQWPLLGQDQIRLDIFAGIRENGQATSPIVYPLLSAWSTDIGASPGETITVSPVFTYAKTVRFALIEDFETSNSFRQDLDGDSLTMFSVSEVNAIEGKSARACLKQDHPDIEVASNFSYSDLPANGTPVFLELEYASDTPLAVGLKSSNGGRLYKLLLFANEMKPQKIYVNFTAEVEAATSRDFEVIFRATYDTSSGKAEQQVVLDNIKLLHFRS